MKTKEVPKLWRVILILILIVPFNLIIFAIIKEKGFSFSNVYIQLIIIISNFSGLASGIALMFPELSENKETPK